MCSILRKSPKVTMTMIHTTMTIPSDVQPAISFFLLSTSAYNLLHAQCPCPLDSAAPSPMGFPQEVLCGRSLFPCKHHKKISHALHPQEHRKRDRGDLLCQYLYTFPFQSEVEYMIISTE